jgi:hypothetical protein
MDRAYRIEIIKYSVWFLVALAISLWFRFFVEKPQPDEAARDGEGTENVP